jgi:hypothetical protein
MHDGTSLLPHSYPSRLANRSTCTCEHAPTHTHLPSPLPPSPLSLPSPALSRQDPVIDDIEAQVTKHTQNLKTNNVKLKGMIHKMANGRNFCVDVVLLTILMAIGGYIYATFR